MTTNEVIPMMQMRMKIVEAENARLRRIIEAMSDSGQRILRAIVVDIKSMVQVQPRDAICSDCGVFETSCKCGLLEVK